MQNYDYQLTGRFTTNPFTFIFPMRLPSQGPHRRMKVDHLSLLHGVLPVSSFEPLAVPYFLCESENCIQNTLSEKGQETDRLGVMVPNFERITDESVYCEHALEEIEEPFIVAINKEQLTFEIRDVLDRPVTLAVGDTVYIRVVLLSDD